MIKMEMFWRHYDFKANALKIIFESSCQIDYNVAVRFTITTQVNTRVFSTDNEAGTD